MSQPTVTARVIAIVLACTTAPARAAGPAGETLRLKGHRDAVVAAVFSPDSKLVVSGSADHTAIVWDVATGKARHVLAGHHNGINAVAISADGTRTITGSTDHTARVWDVRTGELLAILDNHHDQHVHAVAISPDGSRVVTGSCDRTATLWDVAAERPIQTYRYGGEVHALDFAPDGKTFLASYRSPRANAGGNVGPVDKHLRLYDAKTAAEIHAFALPSVDQAFFVDGGKRIMIRCHVEAWIADVAAQTVERDARVKETGTWVAMGPAADGGAVILGYYGRGARALNLTTGLPLFTSPAQREPVRAVALSPDGRWALYAGGGRDDVYPWTGSWVPATDVDVKLASLVAGPPRDRFVTAAPPPPPGQPEGARPRRTPRALSTADGTRVLTSDGNGVATCWDAATGKSVGRLELSGKAMLLAISAAGERAAAAVARTVTVLDARTGERLMAAEPFGLPPTAIALGPGGTVLAAATAVGREAATGTEFASDVRLWDVATAKELHRLAAADAPSAVTSLVISPDGRTVVAAGGTGGDTRTQGRVAAWDVRSGRTLWTMPAPPAPPSPAPELGLPGKQAPPPPRPGEFAGGVAVSPDSRHVAVAFDAVAYVLDAATGKVEQTLDRHMRPCSIVAFDPDGRRLWTLAPADAVRAWDLTTGRVVRELDVAPAYRSAAFTFVLRKDRRTLFNGVANPTPDEYDLGD